MPRDVCSRCKEPRDVHLCADDLLCHVCEMENERQLAAIRDQEAGCQPSMANICSGSKPSSAHRRGLEPMAQTWSTTRFTRTISADQPASTAYKPTLAATVNSTRDIRCYIALTADDDNHDGCSRWKLADSKRTALVCAGLPG